MTPEYFRFIRKTVLKVTQRDLGTMIGYKEASVSLYERGVKPLPIAVIYAMYWLAMYGEGLMIPSQWHSEFTEADGNSGTRHTTATP